MLIYFRGNIKPTYTSLPGWLGDEDGGEGGGGGGTIGMQFPPYLTGWLTIDLFFVLQDGEITAVGDMTFRLRHGETPTITAQKTAGTTHAAEREDTLKTVIRYYQ